MTNVPRHNIALRNMRIRHHLTQEQLAEIAGVAQKTVNRWESYAAFPRAYSLQKLCACFHATLAELGFPDLSEAPEMEREQEAEVLPLPTCLILLLVGSPIMGSFIVLKLHARR